MARNPDGTFKKGDPETREAARRGGKNSPGAFTTGSDRARQAGKRGGTAS